MKNLNLLLLMIVSSSAHTASAPLFSITETGTPSGLINITLCLNAKAQLSCQRFNVSTLSLSIKTTIPNHTYTGAGIRINTPGYTLAAGTSCTALSNGYCQLSTSNTAAANINIDNGQSALNQYVYVPNTPSQNQGFIEQCTLESNGSFTTYEATPHVAPSWVPSGIAFATSNNTTHAYVSSTAGTIGVFMCALSDGALSNCVQTATPAPDRDWFGPRGIAFAASSNQQYAYIPDGVPGRSRILHCRLSDSEGTLEPCVNAARNNPAPLSFATAIAFKTTTAEMPIQYAYITDAEDGSVYSCPLDTNGTFDGDDCVQTVYIHTGDSGYYTNGIAFATFNATTYAYITNNDNSTVYQCAWNADSGALSNCIDAKPEDPIAWNLTGIAFGTVNGIQYAYVSDFSAGDPYASGTIWQCHVNSTTGLFTRCDKTPTTSPTHAWTVNGAVGVYPAVS